MRVRKAMMGWGTAAVVALSAAGVAAAQEAGSRQTREFVQAAGQSDQFELLEGRTALTESTDPQVRAFAQRMIQAHGETSRTLAEAAARAGLGPPPHGIDGDQARLLGELQSLRGPEFDRAYLRHQALAHRSALATTQAYAAAGDDPAIRRAAAAAVPVISSHLAEAERMRSAQGGS